MLLIESNFAISPPDMSDNVLEDKFKWVSVVLVESDLLILSISSFDNVLEGKFK